jgi:hypothetical protein
VRDIARNQLLSRLVADPCVRSAWVLRPEIGCNAVHATRPTAVEKIKLRCHAPVPLRLFFPTWRRLLAALLDRRLLLFLGGWKRPCGSGINQVRLLRMIERFCCFSGLIGFESLRLERGQDGYVIFRSGSMRWRRRVGWTPAYLIFRGTTCTSSYTR